jgi:predicted RNA-binding protein
MKNYWFFVTDEKNWKIIKKNKMYAVKEKYLKQFNLIHVGDVVAVYVKRKKIGGIFSIESKEESAKALFGDKEYKYKINLKKNYISKYPLEVSDMLIKRISIFKNINRWGTVLMGRAIIKIKKEDTDYINKLLRLL